VLFLGTASQNKLKILVIEIADLKLVHFATISEQKRAFLKITSMINSAQLPLKLKKGKNGKMASCPISAMLKLDWHHCMKEDEYHQ